MFHLEYCYEDEFYEQILDFFEKPGRTPQETDFWTSQFIIALMKIYKNKGRMLARITKNCLILILSLFYTKAHVFCEKGAFDIGVDFACQDLLEFCESLEIQN